MVVSMLHQFLVENRERLIVACREKVARRRAPLATQRELEFGIPVFLDQLAITMLRENPAESSNLDQERSSEPQEANLRAVASNHGNELLLSGFSVDQVVHDYGDLCQAITELAIEQDAEITNAEFRTLNRCLDNAIADAVAGFARSRDRFLADSNERTTNERLGFLAHEFRNLLNTATLAVAAIKQGTIGISGATGAVLDRSLKGLRDLCSKALVDVRVRAGVLGERERVRVKEFIDEARVAATIEAKAKNLELVVPEVDPNLFIAVDPQIVSGALANLLQNAFKFTKPESRVTLRAIESGDRIRIEVEDECGGLPLADPAELFRLFEQRGVDRTGFGLGLGISRRAVESNSGTLEVTNLPGRGCVFSISLPRAQPES